MSLQSLYNHFGDCRKESTKIEQDICNSNTNKLCETMKYMQVGVAETIEVMLNFTAHCNSLTTDECCGRCRKCCIDYLTRYIPHGIEIQEE